MKEKIINFLKSKTQPEAKFIILGLLYIIAMNVMTPFRIFDLLTFFCIYFCIKHLNSKPTLSKKRIYLSSAIIIIFVLEIWMLINYVFFICFSSLFYSQIKSSANPDFTEIDLFTVFLSFILFLIYWIVNYLKSNPNKIIDIIKTFIFELFQFFAVAIFYFLIIKFTPEKYDSSFLTLAIAINIILLSRTNILAKRVSTMLETLSIGYLFIQLTFIALASERLTIVKHLSLENYIVIFILIINLIGLSIIFFQTKSRAEKSKIILLIALMTSFFFDNNNMINLFYYLASLIFIRLMILCKTLKTSKVFTIFIILNIFFFLFSIPLSQGRGGGAGFDLLKIFILNLILMPIIIFFSNKALKKHELKNGDQSAPNFLQK